MTNPISDYERNLALGLLTDPNDPFSFRKDTNEHRPAKKKPEQRIPLVVFLKDVGTQEDPCWVPCAKGDRGAVAFVRLDEV